MRGILKWSMAKKSGMILDDNIENRIIFHSR